MKNAGIDHRPDTSDGACEYETLVGPYVDGELPLGERDDLDRHLESCESCARLAESFHGLDDLARRSSVVPDISAGEWGGVWQGIQRGIQSDTHGRDVSEPRGSRRVFRIVSVLAAAALILFGIWIGTELVRGRSPTNDNNITEGKPDDPNKPKIELDENGRPIEIRTIEKSGKDG